MNANTTNLSDRQADRALAGASPEALLRTFAALTHQLHDAAGRYERDLRAQRDKVQAELLRRMGA